MFIDAFASAQRSEWMSDVCEWSSSRRRCWLSIMAWARVCPGGSSYAQASLAFWQGLQTGRTSSH